MNLASMTLRYIITQPILQQRRIQRSRAQRIESESLARMHDCEFASQGQDGTFGGCVSELGRCGADERDDRGGVDYGAAELGVTAEGEHGVLAAKPDAFYVDCLGEVWRGELVDC
jgi:hypothetical protein